MFIDTHCHLTGTYCQNNNLETTIKNAKDCGVEVLICPTADPEDIPNAIEIANKHDNIFCTIGIHPEHTGVKASDYITKDILTNPKVIGVGEIGLDYHECAETKQEQIKLFEEQLNLAKQYDLPVAIHSREAEQDTADILGKDSFGVMHCFTSSWWLAKTMLDRGFYFSASGIITFKNAEEIRETFKKIPLDRIVIETDAPYCAPVPYRGKVCEPAMVIETAKVVASIKGLSLEQLEPILMQNTQNLYKKIVL